MSHFAPIFRLFGYGGSLSLDASEAILGSGLSIDIPLYCRQYRRALQRAFDSRSPLGEKLRRTVMRTRIRVAVLLALSPLRACVSYAQTIRVRVAISRLIWAMLTALLGVGVAQAQIHVTEAQIGCIGDNGIKENQGNLTAIVGAACNNKFSCSYKAKTEDEYKRMGVPVHGRFACTEAMEITYHCGTGASKSTMVPGNACDHPPAELFCEAPPNNTGPQNPQLVPVLQGLLQKYQWGILEGQEPGEANNIAAAQVRNTGNQTCVDGNICTYGSRHVTFSELQDQARRGDPINFEAKMKSAILNDCFKCDKHAKMHTKQVHCTMDCGGNNGITQGPCFEGCKAGVDFTKLVNDIVNDIHGILQGVGLAGNNEPASATGGLTIATNHVIVDPSGVAESCGSRPLGYLVALPDLLGWTPTQAPQYKESLTNYEPPSPPTRNQYNPAALSSNDSNVKPNIGASEGRLRPDLRDAAARRNPLGSLCESAAAFTANNASDGNAFADLSVTGRHTFAAFRAQPPQEAQILACLQSNPRTKSMPAATLQNAADAALNRAYRVLNLLQAGGWPMDSACSAQRSPLGYIAVSGEDDQPHRPVNVPSAEFPQYDLDGPVARPSGPPLLVHTRYMIAHTFPPPGSERPSCANTGRTMPAERAPVLAADAEVFLYIHGMDSRLEEALDLTHAIRALGLQRKKNYTVISMDLPTSGYADNIDYNTIAPLNADGHADGGLLGTGLGFAPNKYDVPIVDFIENFIVSFVNTLDRSTQVTHHRIVPIGGSLGGNMSFRLGRPRLDAPWITTVVPWSPAAIWPSFADDGAKHAGLAGAWYFAGGDPAYAQETPGARRSFFYGGFDWQSKAAWVIPLGGGRPQAEYWYRDGWACKPVHMRLARIDRYETYDHNFRLWHWRLGMEQLLFSQQILRPGTNPPEPLYLSNTKRMLLLCGVDDIGGDLCKDTRDVAPKMEMTPGHALFLQTTGHSIHNERPNFLARQIIDFVDGSAPAPPPPPPLRTMTVKGQSGRDGTGIQARAWLIVTAVDSKTGQPVNGNVSVRAGVAGQVSSDAGASGQKFYYTRGGARVVKKPGIEPQAEYCSVVVTAQGYSPGSIKVSLGLAGIE